MDKREEILIIGAGLCGSLLALRLAQRGHKLAIYESRPDLRKTDISAGRSINLALSDRGLKALKLVGLESKVREKCIPMYGRCIHDLQGNTLVVNYSGRADKYINSISRSDLNSILLDEAEKNESVNIHFDKKCTSVDIKNTKANFICRQTNKNISVDAKVIFGTDGAGSALRKSYELDKKLEFDYTYDYLNHGYKELEIPANPNKEHRLSKNHLHIWPRGEYMLIALPNLDGSFTVTLFLSYDKGKYNFDNLTSNEKVNEFFKTQFPDALSLMPSLIDDFFKNSTAALGTIKCSVWHHHKTLLMGDSAHAIVPFYGQGMNASFEDVSIFDSILESHSGDWEAIFSLYQKERKQNTDAIADLAIDNFYEMRDHTANPLFRKKRKIEMALEKHFPDDYFSKYSMVTFNEQLPYKEALSRGRAQDKRLLDMLAQGDISYDSKMTKNELKALLNKIKAKI